MAGKRPFIYELQERIWASGLPLHLKSLLAQMSRYADAHYGSIYPSVETLAAQRHQKVRGVQQDLLELRQMGILVKENDGKGGRHRTTHYRIDVTKLPTETMHSSAPFGRGKNGTKPQETMHSSAPFTDEQRASEPGERVHWSAEKGALERRKRVHWSAPDQLRDQSSNNGHFVPLTPEDNDASDLQRPYDVEDIGDSEDAEPEGSSLTSAQPSGGDPVRAAPRRAANVRLPPPKKGSRQTRARGNGRCVGRGCAGAREPVP